MDRTTGAVALSLAIASTAILAAPTTAAAPTSLVRKHSQGDTALARRVLLGQADLGPGWAAAPAAAAESALTCPGAEPRLPGVVETGAATSDSFQRSPTGPFLSASSWVYGTPQQAATVWERVVARGLLGCLVRSVQQGSASGVKLTVRSTAPMPLPQLAPHTAAYRVVAAARTSAGSVSAYYTLIVLGRGRLIAELSLASLTTPLPAASELTLARRAARRL